MSHDLTNQLPRTLADYTARSLMIPQLRSQAMAGVVAELCALLQREGRLQDSATFYEAVMKREQLSSTCISCGWALPHARLSGLSKLSFVFARSSQPFVWSTDTRSPVHTVILFAVPELEAKSYLSLISAVARLSQNSALVEQLRCAPDAGSMFALLQQVPIFRPSPGVPNPAVRKPTLLKV